MRVDVINEQDVFIMFDGNGTQGCFPAGFNVMILFTDSDAERIYTDKGVLQDGPLNSLGERECYHVSLKGNAIAISEKDMTYQLQDVRLGADPNIFSSFPALRWRDHNLTWQTKFGLVAYNGLPPGSRVFPVPDSKNLLGAQNRNGSLTYRNLGKNTYSVRRKFEYRSGPTKPWNNIDITWFYIVDLERRRMRQITSSGWRTARIVTRNRSAPTIPFSAFRFPRSLGGYTNLHERLLRRYVKPPSDHLFFGDLVRRCANDAQVIQTNSLELVSELAVLSQSVKSIYQLANGKVNAKNLASAFLSYKYGPRLTGVGIKSVVDGLGGSLKSNRGKIRSARAREVFLSEPVVEGIGTYRSEFNYKMSYNIYSNDWRDGVAFWFNTGLFPSLTNAWDLIPLSFVMDWFFKMENYLNSVDANTYWSLYNIAGITFSKKETFHDVNQMLTTPGWSLLGSLSFVKYDRQLTRNAHTPLYFEPSPHEFRNYAELTSLIVANTR